MTPTTIPLPVAGRSQPGTAHCPHCGKRIGMETRCPHVDVLLTPSENGGQWGLLVWDVPFEVPEVRKIVPRKERRQDPPKKPRAAYGGWMDAVRNALAQGQGTAPEIQQRLGGKRVTLSMCLHRLWATGQASIVGKATTSKRRPAWVYAITAAGMVKVAESGHARG